MLFRSPTRRIARGGGPAAPGTPPLYPPGPPARPQPQRPGLPPNPPRHQPGPAAKPPEQTTTRLPAKPKAVRSFFRKPTSIVLVLVVVVAVIALGLIGAELYARHTADSKVAAAVECEVQDSASVSFTATPPVLWQYLTSHYTRISVQTAGNQVRDVKGMKIGIDLEDLRLNRTTDSKGTIAALDGTITWSSDGIKQSIQDAIPVLGSFVTSKVTPHPSDGTVELKGLLDSATIKPQIVDNGLSLQVVNLTALGSKLSTDTVQKNLDDLTSKATKNYPLGIHADSVKVTDSGVQATFSSRNATIPASSSQPQSGQDCFSGV